MVAIEASEEEVGEALERQEAELSLAAINGPASVVALRQPRGGRRQLEAHCEEQGAQDQAPRASPTPSTRH